MIFSRSTLASLAILATTTLVFFSPFSVGADNVDVLTSFLKQRESLHDKDKKAVQTFDLHRSRDWDEGGGTIETDEQQRSPLIRGGTRNSDTNSMIECTFTEALSLLTPENKGIRTLQSRNLHCHESDSDTVYQLEGLDDEHIDALSLQSGHTKLKIPLHYNSEDYVLHIEDPFALSVSNDHQDHQHLSKTGDYKVLVVIVTDRFGNKPSQSEAQMTNDVFQDKINLSERYQACSKNQLTFSPATGQGVNNGVITVQTPSNLSNVSYSNCGNLALSVLPGGISRSYTMFVCPDVANFGDAAALGERPGSLTWYLSRYASAADVQVHEIGHNLGFHHSGINLTDCTYCDGTCHMSNEGGFRDDSRKFCFNAAKFHQINWFPEFYTTVAPTSENFEGDLVGINDVVTNKANSGSQELVVKIHGSGQDDLFMMFNRKKGINSEVPEHGDQVVIVSQRSSSAISVRIATLSAGQIHTIQNWANSGNALKIKVCSVSKGGDVASVIAYLDNVNKLYCKGSGGSTGTFIKSVEWNTFLRFNSGDVDMTTNQREWERITLEKFDGNMYAIKSAHHSNMYLRFGGAGEGNVVNTQTYPGPWEKFYIQELGGGKVTFKNVQFGNYPRAWSNGHLDTQTYVGAWEQYIIITDVMDTFDFYPMVDSPGYDIKHSYAGDIKAFADECNANPKCEGFNSNGWIKHIIRPQSHWSKWTNDTSKGIYVKK